MPSRHGCHVCQACHELMGPGRKQGWCAACQAIRLRMRQAGIVCRGPIPAQGGRGYRLRLLQARAWLGLPLFPFTAKE